MSLLLGMDSTLKNSHGELGDDDVITNTKVPKTWYERKCDVEMVGSTEEALFAELEFTAKLLHDDAWNKFAWSHRQWVLEKLDRGYADELGFCEEIFRHENNTHNRLIWDQRCFAVQKCLAKGIKIIRSCEVTVAMGAILYHPEDENPWRYLRLLYKNDMKALARHTHLQWALIRVFVEARDRANAVRADKVMYEHEKHAQLFDSVNKRGCLFAVDLVSDLLKHGHQPDKEAEDAFDEVFQEYDGLTFAERVDSVLRAHRLELMELCADFMRVIIDTPGGMETTPVVEGVIPEWESCWLEDYDGWGEPKIRIPSSPPPPFPRSELCGKAGFSHVAGEKEEDSPHERSPNDHKDQYSVLPESLRNSCREMVKYSASELINHTHALLFFQGHVWQLSRLAIRARGFSLENEVEVLKLLGETTSIDNYLFCGCVKCLVKYLESIGVKLNLIIVIKSLKKMLLIALLGIRWHETRGNEVKYAIDAILAEPENEMPWTYLKCLVSGKNYKVLNDSSTRVLSDVVKHIKEGKVDIRHEAYVKKRVVNALKMVLFAVKGNDFKPNHDMKMSIDFLCPSEAAETSFVEKVVSILRSVDVSWMWR
ncbi:protein farnesyltransferase/ geranylgeranyltransferase type-1 subunit alpha [Phtheirospermum japonicum]|uniref:Protein farnesyltransferase/geranylgeranyltransferase type-1 subunit alpha n=1 Tax=Phtheirospermum japonicum TaxID=374723 RepID=A0A830BU89_9LAMI|nr:protein farnesyltransferase/ geranylgeranyltransferase type-1 subunit alpha [Phtheirospermum japonicum]